MEVLEQRLESSWPPDAWRSRGVLVAVSGGADSVALLCAMAALCGADRSPLRAAHLNHRLRGKDADLDERFVQDLCRRLGVPCDVERVDMAAEAKHRGESFETASRACRYEFLQRAAETNGIGYVATAHTADDQVETILHRIVRGTGLVGVAGIPRARSLGVAVTLLRPLLEVRRTEIVEYLETIEQPFREDATNTDTGYTRNRIRHELLPLLRRDYNANVDEALLRLGDLAAELNNSVVEPQVSRLALSEVTMSANGSIVIHCRPMADVPKYIVRELLIFVWTSVGWPRQAMGYAQWELLRTMIDSPQNSQPQRNMLPGGISAVRDASTLVLSRAPAGLT